MCIRDRSTRREPSIALHLAERPRVGVTEVVAAGSSVFNVLGMSVLRKRRKGSFEKVNSRITNKKFRNEDGFMAGH